MLTECKLGPTVQTIGRTTYYFEMDGAGRAVCEVGSGHLHLFLARPEVYAVVELVLQAGLLPVVSKAAELKVESGIELVLAASYAGSRLRPRRGRPSNDDSVALAQMSELMANGMSLNAAAAVAAGRLVTGESAKQNSVRKRLLRKYRERGESPDPDHGPDASRTGERQ